MSEAARSDGRGIAIRLANAYCVSLAADRLDYKALMAESGVNFPDGAPVANLMNRLGSDDGRSCGNAKRVRGPSYFEATLRHGRKVGLRHFFLGATPETLDRLCVQMQLKFPGLVISGTYAPPFAPVDPAGVMAMVDRILPTSSDIVWVGMGTPKQDFVAVELAKALSCPVAGVGAAFNFAAGTAKEAPIWIQRSGFEWLFRLATEPKRLWRRYIYGNSKFIRIALTALAQRRR